MSHNLADSTWRTSSYSGEEGGTCVEVTQVWPA
ncbi:DUF397 domain-containing protein [Actinoallomurus sp. CA-150999]